MTSKKRVAMQPSQQAVAAMRLALEALELCGADDMAYIKSEKAIIALREALAEPVSKCAECLTDNGHQFHCSKAAKFQLNQLAEQAEQSQLADATLEPFLEVFCDPSYFDMWCVRDVHDKDFNHTIHVNSKETANHAKLLIENWVKKYSAPVRTKDPCHPWQDLTDDEIADCGDFAGVFTLTDLEFARAVIAADREKNK